MKKIIILLALLMIASPVFAVTVSKVNNYKVLINGKYPLDFRYAKTFFYSPVSNRAVFVFSTGEKTSVPCSEQEYKQLILKLQPLVNQYQIDFANGKIPGTYLYEEMKRQREAKKSQPRVQPQEQEQAVQTNEETQQTYAQPYNQTYNQPVQEQSQPTVMDNALDTADTVLKMINLFK
jgi:hypothetical protein